MPNPNLTRVPLPEDRTTIDLEKSLRDMPWQAQGIKIAQEQCIYCLRTFRDHNDGLSHVHNVHVLRHVRPIGSPEEVEQLQRAAVPAPKTPLPAGRFPVSVGDPEGDGLSMEQLEDEG